MYIRDFFRAAKIGDQDSLSQTLPGIALFLLILTNKGQCDKMLIFIFVIYALILYRVFIKYCVFFPRILESLPPLPRQHSAAIGCTKNYQPIGVTVHF